VSAKRLGFFVELEGIVFSILAVIFQLVIHTKPFGYPIFHPQIIYYQ